jgi:two-component system, OmpR family, sensor histidine kinase TctE
MFWKPAKRLSLRAKMLAVLLPGMLAVIGAELWLTRVDAIEAANGAFDRSLNGAIRSVDLNVSTSSGGLSVELPYRLFEFFQLTARGNVYFRVATADGLVEIGSPDLPQPAESAPVGTAVFHDAVYFGEPVRVGTYVRALEQPLSAGQVQHLVIQVAESVESRRAFTNAFVLRAAVRDVVVISLVGITLAVLITLMLRPVSRLAVQVSARQPSDLRPLDQAGLPRDIQPLVDAVNQQLGRTRDLMDRQRAFLDDASHQLRTPLATLHAQVGYALRQRNATELSSTLASIAEQLEHATRSTNQLLALARSDAVTLHQEPFDLNALLTEIGTRLLPLARAKGLDFGVEVGTQSRPCHGDRLLLAEAIVNLTHNAIVYSDPHGQVTLAAPRDPRCAIVRITNSGPPIPPHVISRVGERFVKGEGHKGAGLGLAISKSVIERHGGRLEVQSLPDEHINVVSLSWPAA